MRTDRLTLGPQGEEPDNGARCWSCDEVVAPQATSCRFCGATLNRLNRLQMDERLAPVLEHAPRHDENPHHNTAAHRARETAGPADRRREPLRACEPESAVHWTDADFARISRTAGLPGNDNKDPGNDRSERTAESMADWSEIDFERISQSAGSLDEGDLPGYWARRNAGGLRAPFALLPRPALLLGGASAAAVVAAVVAIGMPTDSVTPTQVAMNQSERVIMPGAPGLLSGGLADEHEPWNVTTAAGRPDDGNPAPSERESMAAAGERRPGPPQRQAGLALPPPPETVNLASVRPQSQPSSSPFTVPVPPRRWSVSEVQRELSRYGYYSGTVDGLAGPQTQRALQEFQIQEGLEPTGRIGPGVTQALERRASEFARQSGGGGISPGR